MNKTTFLLSPEEFCATVQSPCSGSVTWQWEVQQVQSLQTISFLNSLIVTLFSVSESTFTFQRAISSVQWHSTFGMLCSRWSWGARSPCTALRTLSLQEETNSSFQMQAVVQSRCFSNPWTWDMHTPSHTNHKEIVRHNRDTARAPIPPLFQHLPLQGSARRRAGSMHSLCTACSFSHA